MTANIESDLDNYQSSLLEYSTIKSAITLIPQGSESELQGGAVVSKFNEGVDNANAIPKGSFVSVGIGDTIRHQFKPNVTLDRARLANYLLTTWNQSKSTGDIEIYQKAGYTYQLFGKSAAVNLNVFKEKKPVEPKAPTAPSPVKSSGQDISIDVSDARMVITKHIDITTGKEISKQEDGKQPKKDIPGYEFVETKDEGGNTIHYYKQVQKETPKVTPKELPKTSEQAKQRNTAIIALLSVVGLGGLATYLGLRKRDEN